jgi:hypothetical protein
METLILFAVFNSLNRPVVIAVKSFVLLRLRSFGMQMNAIISEEPAFSVFRILCYPKDRGIRLI